MPDADALLAGAEAFMRGPGDEYGRRIESEGRIPPELWADLRGRGYLRLTAPERYGGMGLGLETYLPLLEVLSSGHGALRMMVHVPNGIWRAVLWRADPAQAERLVPPLVAGRRIMAFALTEPDAGTGTDISTTATRAPGAYVLNGRKHLVTFADCAHDFLVFARLPGTRGGAGSLALVVPRESPGLTILPQPAGMGLHGIGHGQLVFRDCPVPAGNLLGGEGDGLDVALRGFLDPSRLGIAASCVGLAQRSLDLAVRRARERVTFGRPLAERQAIQLLIGRMAADVEAARQLTRWAARRWDAAGDAAAAAMAKYHAAEALQRVTDGALQVFGGIGYLQGSTIERIYRDARGPRFEEGTAELLCVTVARSLLRPEGRLRAGEAAAAPAAL